MREGDTGRAREQEMDREVREEERERKEGDRQAWMDWKERKGQRTWIKGKRWTEGRWS